MGLNDAAKNFALFQRGLFLAPSKLGAVWPSILTAALLSFCWGILLIGNPGALVMTLFKKL